MSIGIETLQTPTLPGLLKIIRNDCQVQSWEQHLNTARCGPMLPSFTPQKVHLFGSAPWYFKNNSVREMFYVHGFNRQHQRAQSSQCCPEAKRKGGSQVCGEGLSFSQGNRKADSDLNACLQECFSTKNTAQYGFGAAVL